MSKNEITVLTEEKIKQKMAGYKSHYTRKVNAAKTRKERKSLETARESYLADRLAEIVEFNKKQIQRRAGFLAWETRRANNAKRMAKAVAKPATPKAEKAEKTAKKQGRRMRHSVGIRVISK